MRLFFKKGIIMTMIALILLTLPIGNFIVSAETNTNEPYEIKITSGIEGKFRALKYMPVTVEFTSYEKDFNGEVEIRTAGNYTATYDAYSKEASVAQGETAKVNIPIKMLDGSNSISINLIENGKVLYEKKSLISNGRVSESNLFMGVLTDDPTALSYTGSVSFDTSKGYKASIEKVQLDEKIIGENSLNIDGLDVIIINNYNMSNLKETHYNALNSWINKGGTLIIGAGANDGKTINNIDNDFLSIKSKGRTEKNIKIVDDNLNLIVSDLEIKDGKVKIGDSENPLVYSVNRGKGEILVSTFDIGLEPFISSTDSSKFITSMLDNSVNKLFEVNINGGYYKSYYRTGELISTIPVNDIVGVKSLSIVIAIYAFIIGIVLYIVLKKLNKRDLAWIAIPVVSILFTTIIYFMGSSTRVNDIILNQSNIITVDKDGKGTIKGYLGVGTKYKSDVIIEKPEDLDMNYQTTDNYYGNQGQEVSNILRVKTTYSGNNSYFTFNNSDALDMKTFEVVGKEQIINKIEGSFKLSEGNLNGKIKNNLGYNINRLLLVAGRNVWDIGEISKDEEKEITGLKVAGSGGLQAYSDLLSQKYYEARAKNNQELKSEEFKNIVRISAMVGALSNEIVINKDVKLIAITELPIDYGVNFGTQSISKFDTTAIVQDAELEFKDKNGDYNFPDGYFESTVESSSSNIHIDVNNEYIYGQGEVVFKFEVDSNIEIIDLIIKKGMDIYGNSVEDYSEKYIYNYKTDTYDKFTMSQGYEKITDLDNYINNNTIKVKYVVDDSKGQSMIPMITVKGRER